MGRATGGGTSWWATGDTPDDLPDWARRHLDDAPTELIPSAPADVEAASLESAGGRGRHRRRFTVFAAGRARRTEQVRGQRLRGWGLATFCVAAAAAAVPLAASTIANSGDAYTLPRVGTFPVVAPGDLPGGPPAGPPPGAVSPAPGGDAAALPPLAEAPAAAAPAPRATPVSPLARTQPSRPVTTPAPRTTTGTQTPPTQTPRTQTPRSGGDTPADTAGPPAASDGADTPPAGEGSTSSPGLVPSVLGDAGHLVGGVGRTAGGLLGG